MKNITKRKKVLKHLQEFGSITNLEMILKFFVTCPYSVIRDLRKTYNITDEWEDGHKRYILNGEI